MYDLLLGIAIGAVICIFFACNKVLLQKIIDPFIVAYLMVRMLVPLPVLFGLLVMGSMIGYFLAQIR